MKPTRRISPPGTYFVTFQTFQRRRFFVVESYARLFLKTLYHYRREGKLKLHAFVIMPDHVHLLLTPAPDTTLERALQFIKGGYSHAVGEQISRREIWQKGFTDHRIRDAQDFAGHRLYIHQNPIEAKLVANPPDYRYSSAFPGFKLDPWPPAAEAELGATDNGTTELVALPAGRKVNMQRDFLKPTEHLGKGATSVAP